MSHAWLGLLTKDDCLWEGVARRRSGNKRTVLKVSSSSHRARECDERGIPSSDPNTHAEATHVNLGGRDCRSACHWPLSLAAPFSGTSSPRVRQCARFVLLRGLSHRLCEKDNSSFPSPSLLLPCQHSIDNREAWGSSTVSPVFCFKAAVSQPPRRHETDGLAKSKLLRRTTDTRTQPNRLSCPFTRLATDGQDGQAPLETDTSLG